MSIGDRIREERERLGYTQQEFARLAGASKNSQFLWERGSAFPNAKVMETWADAGVDVLYILTGQRSQPVPPQQLLPESDRILLDNFHHATPGVQAGVRRTLGDFAPGGVAEHHRSRRKSA